MFGRERRMLLRHYLEQGTSQSALARQLGVSRDTIHRWIRAGDLDRDLDDEAVRYGPRPSVATKLARGLRIRCGKQLDIAIGLRIPRSHEG